jgi:hypothetical protein
MLEKHDILITAPGRQPALTQGPNAVPIVVRLFEPTKAGREDGAYPVRRRRRRILDVAERHQSRRANRRQIVDHALGAQGLEPWTR